MIERSVYFLIEEQSMSGQHKVTQVFGWLLVGNVIRRRQHARGHYQGTNNSNNEHLMHSFTF